jgi:branched-chain amino acid transport system permease protein
MSTSSIAGVGTTFFPRNAGGWLLPVVVACVLAVLPMFLSSYFQDLALKIIVYAIFALSLELLVGTTGLISLGHAAFFGIAGYVTVLFAPEYEQGPILVLLPLSILIAGLYALFVGALSLRTKGIYFIMVTLAFAQMAFFVFHDTPVGRGTDGIYLNVRPLLSIAGNALVDLDNSKHMYFFALGALVVTYGLLALIRRSRFGRALVGIRINEQRMRATGYNTYAYKLAAFVIAGMLAGLAGFLSAARNGIVNPELLSWHESGAVLLMIILGGLGSLRGAVIGAVAFILLKEFYSSEAIFGAFAQRWQLTLGLTMIFLVATLPDGLIGLGDRLKRVAGRKK